MTGNTQPYQQCNGLAAVEEQVNCPQPTSIADIWLPELRQCIASFLRPNDIACGLRLVDKAAASQFRGPQHRTIHLSQPVRHEVFAQKWDAPGAVRCLSLIQRRQLIDLTAASGDTHNLEIAVRVAGCLLTPGALQSAATAGQLATCRWLVEHGCPVVDPKHLLAATALAGQLHVCKWLLSPSSSPPSSLSFDAIVGEHAVCNSADGNGAGSVGGCCCQWDRRALLCAIREGHKEIADWFLELRPDYLRDASCEDLELLMPDIAEGYDLASVQEWYNWYTQRQPTPCADDQAYIASSMTGRAATSRRHDWRAKAEWLLSRCTALASPYGIGSGLIRATHLPDAVAIERLDWFRRNGEELTIVVLNAAAMSGKAELVRWLLEEGGVPPLCCVAFRSAAQDGHLAVMAYLRRSGRVQRSEIESALFQAAYAGHSHIVAWLLGEAEEEAETGAGATAGAAGAPSPASLMTGSVFTSVAHAGKVELMEWLRQRGCPWSANGGELTGAAQAGCEEALEWLVERGCPMPVSGSPYVEAARNGDLATLRCLRRLGCPWGPDGSVFTECVERRVRMPVLSWLLEAGCPVDPKVAAAAMENRPGVAGW